MDLLEIATRACHGAKPSVACLLMARRALSSALPLDRAAACTLLLLSRSRLVPLSKICSILGELCLAVPEAEREPLYWLGNSIALFPDRQILRAPALRYFCYRSLFGANRDCRINNVRLLGRLSRAGDKRAMRLLEIGSTDDDPFVRDNAKY